MSVIVSNPFSTSNSTQEPETAPPSGEGTFYSDNNNVRPYRLLIHEKKKKHDCHWLNVWMQPNGSGASLMELAQRNDLKRNDYRVLCWILSHISLGNHLYLCHTQVAHDLDMKRPNVSASVNRLCKLNILLKTEQKAGRVNSYLLNPGLAYRGKLEEGIKQRRKAAILPFTLSP